MSDARETILQSIRSALTNVPDNEQIDDISVERRYQREGERIKEEVKNLFIERVSEYKAEVKEVNESDLEHSIAKNCLKQSAKKLVIPHRFPEGWLPGAVQPIFDKPEDPLTHAQLDATDGVITTSSWAIAETGTIILDAGPGQGRRVCTLLPDYHLCIVKANQIVETVPEGFAKVASKVKDEGAPITFISGPSATSDIELSRVEGVHGPRELDIIVY